LRCSSVESKKLEAPKTLSQVATATNAFVTMISAFPVEILWVVKWIRATPVKEMKLVVYFTISTNYISVEVSLHICLVIRVVHPVDPDDFIYTMSSKG